MVRAQYRLIRFTVEGCERWVGLAWEYDCAFMCATEDCPTYTEARKELGLLAAKRGAELRWFDGMYQHDRGQLLPIGCADKDFPAVST